MIQKIWIEKLLKERKKEERKKEREKRWNKLIEETKRINGYYEPDQPEEPEDNRAEIEQGISSIRESVNKLERLINNP